jgi:RNA polymerase sigma-70 factor (ECF subfamily)
MGSAIPGFNEMVDQYGKKIYHMIYNLVSNKEDAEDLTQNVFTKIYEKLPSFKGESNIYSWIYRIAYNEAMDFHRSKRRKNILVEDYDAGIQHHSLSHFNEEEAWIILNKMVATLPDRQAEVFLMRYMEDLSYEEMAHRTQISISALKTSYHLACKKIEQQIKNTLNI